MTEKNQNDELIEYLCGSLFDLQGKQHANSILLNSLISVICENAPELIDKIKDKTSDVSELSIKLGELSTDYALESFRTHISQTLKQFELIRESSKFSDTLIEVRKK